MIATGSLILQKHELSGLWRTCDLRSTLLLVLFCLNGPKSRLGFLFIRTLYHLATEIVQIWIILFFMGSVYMGLLFPSYALCSEIWIKG